MAEKKVTNVYNEDSIVNLDYRNSCRQAIGMYIGNNGEQGMHHLAEEIICNSMDEAVAGYGKEIKVVVDSATNTLTVKDGGRGIPFRLNKDGVHAIMLMCTALHAGGKFEKAGNYKTAIGLNGVGATVTNALSSYFRIDSTRADGTCSLEFNNWKMENGTKVEVPIGGVTEGPQITDCKNKETGSTVAFIPDTEVFGKTKWNKKKLLEMLQFHAVMNDNIAFTLVWDNEKEVSYKYKSGEGIVELLKMKVNDYSKDIKRLTKPFSCKMQVAGGHEVEIAFQYVNSGNERIYAFTNGAFNPDYGTHVTGFKTAFTNLINTKAKEIKSLELDGNLEGNSLRKGLVLVLSLKLNERPQFNEQQKLKLISDSARKIVSQAVGQMVIPRADIEAIVEKALLERKAENAAQRQREAERRVGSGGKKLGMKDLPTTFTDAIFKKGAEVFFVEGKSAAGSAKEGRDPNTQAIYPMKGKPLNTHSKELADLVANKEIKDILRILGCGVGEGFNIKNLHYDKIIFLSDADVK